MNNNTLFYLFIGITFLSNDLIFAQNDSVPDSKITIGGRIGYLKGHYRVKKANWTDNGLGDTLSGVAVKSQGFSAAFHLGYNINSRFSLQMQLGTALDDLILTFFRKDGKNRVSIKDNVYVQIPIDVVYTFTEMKIKPSLLFEECTFVTCPS